MNWSIFWTAIGIGIPVVIWLLGLSFSLGRMWEKVKGNCDDIERNRNELKADIENYRKENKADHRLIFDKLDELVKLRSNGHGNNG